MAYTRVQLRDLVRQRLGWPAADTFVVDSELNNYLNDALVELHSLLATVYRPGQWGTTKAGLVVLAGAASGLLGTFTDFGRLLKVELLYNQQYVPLDPSDRTVEITNTQSLTWTPYNVRYQLSVDGANTALLFTRPTPADITVYVTYLRAAPVLSADGNSSWMDWDEYLILDAMIKAREKEEDNTSSLVAQKNALQARIRAQAEPLDMGRAATVQDVRSLEEYRGGGEEASWWRRWG